MKRFSGTPNCVLEAIITIGMSGTTMERLFVRKGDREKTTWIQTVGDFGGTQSG